MALKFCFSLILRCIDLNHNQFLIPLQFYGAGTCFLYNDYVWLILGPDHINKHEHDGIYIAWRLYYDGIDVPVCKNNEFASGIILYYRLLSRIHLHPSNQLMFWFSGILFIDVPTYRGHGVEKFELDFDPEHTTPARVFRASLPWRAMGVCSP